ncbi:hypothetical protein [Piscirickettsia litoralis]|uniref:Uncharacterized protein n=1 Tax=Piscirickettsia litoralis TaxID=1891921 RepID=A0ABX2ZYA4_9GAMM|nr:hypothetical protein [Piscirickettsia litoralis]ODN41473.1 hypothetical protein BGC07_15255 [Piscirickettsia litoralis]
MNMIDPVIEEKEQVKKIAKQLGNPCILPNFRLLDEMVEELYCEKLYRVQTLHKICDQVCHDDDGGDGDGDGDGENAISPYSVISVLYLINPRRAMSVFIDFICSYDSVENVIRHHSKRLGVKVTDKAPPMVMSKVAMPEKEVDKGKNYGVSLG